MKTQLKEQTKIAEQAAQWLVSLEEDPGHECRAAFIAWLKHSPRHVEEFLITAAAYGELDRLDPQKHLNVTELLASDGADIVPLQADLPIAKRKGRWSAPRWMRQHKAVVGLAAGIAALIAGSILFSTEYPAGEHFQTAIGEQRSIRLDDGSVIYLNTRSNVTVRLSEKARDVRLLEGEALFIVAPDSTRPFRVRTDSATIQAVGTQFNVYERDEATMVSVVEGKVRVMPKAHSESGSSSTPQLVAAGEEVRVSRSEAIKRKAPDLPRTVAWRQRQFVFSGDTLADVIEQVNRYNRMQVRIADPDLAQRRLSGIFNVDDLDSLLGFLNEDGALAFERRDNDLIIRRNTAAAH